MSDASKKGLSVRVDFDRCIGNGMCARAAPGVYALDEETRTAVILDEEHATVEQFFAGARACPTQAIIIEQYGRRMYPQIMPRMFDSNKDPGDPT